MIKLDRSSSKLVMICAAGIILNITVGKLADMLGLPFYLDTIGTMFIAALGGYIPGIAVGFSTNIFASGFDVNEMYYGIVNVSVGIITAFLASKGYFDKFPRVLLVIPATALMTTFMGGLIEKLLIISSSWASPEQILLHMLEKFQLELPDKGLSVLLSFFALKFVPHDLTQKFGRFGKMQAPVSPEIRRAIQTKSKFVSSLSTKLIFTLMSVTLAVAFFISLISYVIYRDNIIREHRRIADGIITMAVNEIDPKRVDEFIALGHKAEGYSDVEHKLYKIRAVNSDVKYLYVYKIMEDGCHVVFDLSTADLKASSPGDIVDFDKEFLSVKNDLLAGRPIAPRISNGQFGYLLTIYKPVYDSVGHCVCYAGIDFSMDAINDYGRTFIVKVIALFSGVVILIFAVGMWFIENNIILPVNTMAYCARNFAYNSETAREQNIERMRSLEIKTHDEIENLYSAFLKTTTDSMRYFDNLRKAKIQVAVMEELAHTDSLTGIKNKTAYIETTNKLDAAIAEGHAEFSIVMIDVNYLKKVNDTYGHERGNEYLINACKLVCEVFGKENVYRIGGDEFVAVLYGEILRESARLVKNLRGVINKLRNDSKLEPWEKVSAAVGVAYYEEVIDSSADDVFKRADAQMYKNKLAMKAVRKD